MSIVYLLQSNVGRWTSLDSIVVFDTLHKAKAYVAQRWYELELEETLGPIQWEDSGPDTVSCPPFTIRMVRVHP